MHPALIRVILRWKEMRTWKKLQKQLFQFHQLNKQKARVRMTRATPVCTKLTHPVPPAL
jgi:hypothetical protein